MKVTKSNFRDLLPSIKREIQEAHFLAIDCEFSGISSIENICNLDLLEDYYVKIRNGSCRFLLLQLGLSIFRYNETEKVYENNSYSFYVFPQPNERHSDNMFLSQISSISFLANYNFDFNTLFRDGIPYITKENYELKKERFLNNMDDQSQKNIVNVPLDEQEFITRILKNIGDFLKDDNKKLMTLEKSSAFQRKLIYQEVEANFGPRVVLKTEVIDKDRIILVHKITTKDDYEILRDQQASEFMTNLNNDYGFSEIIDCIVKSRKLILGHNMLLDIIHIINHFIFKPPNTLSEFKEFVKEVFPNLLDTKLLGSSDDFKGVIKSTVLSELVSIIQKKPFIIPEIRSSENYSIAYDEFHDAAFDSFCTGVCFLSLIQYLTKKFNVQKNDSILTSPVIESFKNKIFVMKLKDFGYIDLRCEQKLKSNRNNVFHLTFPKDWKYAEIYKLFQGFGLVEISWINSTSVYVTLQNRNNINPAFNTISKNKDVTIMRYKDFKQKTSDLEKVTNQVLNDKKRKAPEDHVDLEKKKKPPKSNSITNEDNTTTNVFSQEKNIVPSTLFKENMNFE